MNFSYPYFDAHCDTITELYKNKSSINNSKYMVNLSHLKKYFGAVQVFAIYNSGSLFKENIISILEFLKEECKLYNEFISFETTEKAMLQNHFANKITAFASIESLGSQKDFSPNHISFYKQKGVKIMSLCHNADNPLCGGCALNQNGLTPLGRESLRLMQKTSVILDVSHMSHKSFWEAIAEYSLPFMATHSNSSKIHNHPRNLTDEQFICLAKRGGVCGINYYPPHLGKKANIETVIKHIEHFMSLGGENAICLGSDFDGIEKTAQNLENAGCVYRLFNKLLSINYNETLINKIAFNNFHNFLKNYETLA